MKKTMAALAVGLVSAVLVLLVDALGKAATPVSSFDPLTAVEMKTYDWRMTRSARPDTARQDIALITIDEYSLRNLEPNLGRWPWPRMIHGALIDYLARAPAKVIAYDVNFAGPDTQSAIASINMSGAESDASLAESVKKAGNVIMLADATFDGKLTTDDDPLLSLPDPGYRLDVEGIRSRPVVYPPFPALAHESIAIGHNVFVNDPDGPMRHLTLFIRHAHRAMPVLGAAVAMRVGGFRPDSVRLDGNVLRIADRVIPLEIRRAEGQNGVESYLWTPINYRGPALLADMQRTTYPMYRFSDLLISEQQLQAKEKPDIDPAIFRDKIVFVGTTAAGLNDVFETPFSHGNMPGIQVHAAVTDDILSNRFIHPASAGVRIGSVLIAGIIIGLVATLIPAWWATAVTLAIVAAFGFVSLRLFANGYWINLVQPVFASSVALLGGVGYQYFVEGREKRKMKRLFGQYVSKDVYNQLVSHPELAHLGGTRREMSVLFSDIRGFTTITEKGQPEEIVGMLNEYFTRMVDIVFKYHGTLDKFVGDMVMALFGAPVDDPQHAEHAVQAALEMSEELKRLNAKWETQGRFANLDIGIGINSGPMIAGNIGSEQIMSYTVIGDAVNLASRLESLNKQYGTRIIISDATRQQLTGAYTFRPLGGVVVKGKSTPVEIFEVVGRAESAPAGQVQAADANKEAV